MPVFLHSESSELNPLLFPKKKVFSNLKKKFRGEPVSDIGQTNEGYKQYETMAGLITKIMTELTEVANVGNTYPSVTPAQNQKRSEAWISLMSAINVTSTTLRRFLETIPNLSQFTPAQYQSISSLFPALQQLISQVNPILTGAVKNTFDSIHLQDLVNRLQGYVVDFQYDSDIPTPKETPPTPSIQVISTRNTPQKTPQPPKTPQPFIGLQSGFANPDTGFYSARASRTPAAASKTPLPAINLNPTTPPPSKQYNRSELQAFAKQNNIKANGTNVEIRQALKERGII